MAKNSCDKVKGYKATTIQCDIFVMVPRRLKSIRSEMRAYISSRPEGKRSKAFSISLSLYSLIAIATISTQRTSALSSVLESL